MPFFVKGSRTPILYGTRNKRDSSTSLFSIFLSPSSSFSLSLSLSMFVPTPGHTHSSDERREGALITGSNLSTILFYCTLSSSRRMECLRIHHWLRLGEKERREGQVRESGKEGRSSFLGMDHSGQNMHTSNYFLHPSFSLSLSLILSILLLTLSSPQMHIFSSFRTLFLSFLSPFLSHLSLSHSLSLSLSITLFEFCRIRKREKSGSWCTDCTHLRAKDNWIARLNDATRSPIFKSRSRLARKERERNGLR